MNNVTGNSIWRRSRYNRNDMLSMGIAQAVCLLRCGFSCSTRCNNHKPGFGCGKRLEKKSTNKFKPIIFYYKDLRIKLWLANGLLLTCSRWIFTNASLVHILQRPSLNCLHATLKILFILCSFRFLTFQRWSSKRSIEIRPRHTSKWTASFRTKLSFSCILSCLYI